MTTPNRPTVITLHCPAADDALSHHQLHPVHADSPEHATALVHQHEARALALRPSDALNPDALARLIRSSRKEAPFVEVVVWAPDAHPRLVRAALRAGAEDVVLDPDPHALAQLTAHTIAKQSVLPRLHSLEQARKRSSRFEGLVSRSSSMWELFETCLRVAPTEANVLILGETGTGKELLARALHKHSRRSGRFVAINCGAVPESLVDSELFGYEKGTFTGATKSKRGLFRHAEGGTLFLDEIGNIPLTAQFSLLRALQEGSIRPVGGNEEIPVDVRVVAATSVPLDQAVAEGRFREDLLYRLDVIRLVIPPLRQRHEDILHLFGHFRKKLAAHYRVSPPKLSDSFLDALLHYEWPGNVRELENFTERLVLTRQGETLTRDHLQELFRPYQGRDDDDPPADATPSTPQPPSADPDTPLIPIDLSTPLPTILEDLAERVERDYLEAALRHTRGRIQDTAELSGLSRRTLSRKLKRFGLDKRDYK